jgi:hypothetical protein
MWNWQMKSNRHDKRDEPANQTAAGVRLMRELWDIPRDKPPPEKPPADVVTDIYCVPDHKHNIPRRSHRSRSSA